MTTKKKLIIAVLIVMAISSIAGYAIFARNRGVVAVQAASVFRQDLTQTVSANGEIKPKKYVNVSSNMMGRIVRLPVKEGDRVRSGDLLVQLEAVQSEADVSSAEASLDASQAEVEGMAASIRSAEAGVTSAKAEITRSDADLARAKLAFTRSQEIKGPKAQRGDGHVRESARRDTLLADVAPCRGRTGRNGATA